MADPFLGEIMLFGGDFAPSGWALCNGRVMNISQNPQLFSLLGTYYGGDGRTTFALPDLRGRVPLGQGEGPGLEDYLIGQIGGSESVPLTTWEMPAHNHPARALTNGTGQVTSPAGAIWSNDPTLGVSMYHKQPVSSPGTMSFSIMGSFGGNQSHSNMQPFLTLNFCIALTGIMPQRAGAESAPEEAGDPSTTA